jgi:hypothetical protein
VSATTVVSAVSSSVLASFLVALQVADGVAFKETLAEKPVVPTEAIWVDVAESTPVASGPVAGVQSLILAEVEALVELVA